MRKSYEQKKIPEKKKTEEKKNKNRNCKYIHKD